MSPEPRDEVSIIIPTVGEDAFLKTAVESAINQSYSNIRVVVVKDGPFSSPWLDANAANGRIHLVTLPRRHGTPIALNAGIAASPHAEYIARLDADDVCDPHRIARQLERLKADPTIGISTTRAKIINDKGETLGIPVWVPSASDHRNLLLTRNFITHSTIVVRGDLIRAVGGYNPKCIRMQDYELYLRLALTHKIDVITDPLVSYRLHGEQNSRRTKPWGSYIFIVARARRALANKLGEPFMRQRFRNVLWIGAQWLRWAGLRNPGFDRFARDAGREEN